MRDGVQFSLVRFYSVHTGHKRSPSLIRLFSFPTVKKKSTFPPGEGLGAAAPQQLFAKLPFAFYSLVNAWNTAQLVLSMVSGVMVIQPVRVASVSRVKSPESFQMGLPVGR